MQLSPQSTNLAELARWSCETYSEVVAIRDGDTSLTYAELGEVTKKAKKHPWFGGDVNGNRPTWLKDAPPFLEGLLRIIQVCKKACGHYSINGLVSESR